MTTRECNCSELPHHPLCFKSNPTNTPSPDEDRELFERLRQMHTSLDGYGALTRPINPDGPAAADRLESLLLDRAKLEDLLTRWLSTAMSGNWRDKTDLSIAAHPVADDTADALNRKAVVERNKSDE